MERKEFLRMSALGLGGLLVPDFLLFGREVDPKSFLETGIDVAVKKQLADIAMNACASIARSCRQQVRVKPNVCCHATHYTDSVPC